MCRFYLIVSPVIQPTHSGPVPPSHSHQENNKLVPGKPRIRETDGGHILDFHIIPYDSFQKLVFRQLAIWFSILFVVVRHHWMAMRLYMIVQAVSIAFLLDGDYQRTNLHGNVFLVLDNLVGILQGYVSGTYSFLFHSVCFLFTRV